VFVWWLLEWSGLGYASGWDLGLFGAGQDGVEGSLCGDGQRLEMVYCIHIILCCAITVLNMWGNLAK